MMKWLQQLKDYFDPPQSGKVTFKYYTRTGSCHGCGQCCSGIYLIHGDEVIQSITEFDRLKKRHEDYRHFDPVEETEDGVRFKCRNLTQDNRSAIYDDRPLFCKKYPSETTLIFGGRLAPACGFQFQPKKTFGEVLSQTTRKKRLRPGKLLYDIFTGRQSTTLKTLPETFPTESV